MARKIEIEISGDERKLRRALKDSEKAIGNTSREFGGLAKAAVIAGGAAGVGALIVGAKKAVDAASNLGESVNAVQVVFGKASKKVLDFSEGAARKAGLSMREFNELVTPVGASMINMGDSADIAAEKSINLAMRAADMASVFNVDVGEALGAIQAGLRGEADPLERFGVGLSDAAVKAKAMAMGLAETEKALTAGDKAQARYALLMEQTDRVAGDFANTSDSLANSKRILAAELENVAAKIGGFVLPMMANLVGFIVDKGIPAIEDLSEWVGANIVPKLQTMADKIEDVVIPKFREWADAIRDEANPAIKELQESFGGMIKEVSKSVNDNMPQVTQAFKDLEQIGSDLAHVYKEVLWPSVKLLLFSWTETMPILLKAVLPVLDKITGALEKVTDGLTKITDALKDMIDWIKKIPDPRDWNFPDPRDLPGAIGRLRPDGDRPTLGGGGAPVPGVDSSLWDEISGGQLMGLQLTSGKRGPRFPGDDSKHISGKAIDMAGAPASMAAFARWAMQRGNDEVFYDPLGYYMDGGSIVRGQIGGHSDHVHVGSFDQGGWLQPGWTLAHNGTGAPERVGGGGNVYVTVNAPNYVGSTRELSEAVQVAVKDLRLNNGMSLV